MPEDVKTAASSQTSQGAATTGEQDAPLTKGELQKVVADTISAQLRGLQSGTDKQIARLQNEMMTRIQALADDLGVTAHSVVEASSADPETKQALIDKLDTGRQAAQGRVAERESRIRAIEKALKANGLTEDDLPHSIESYAKHPDSDLIAEAIERAAAKKKPTAAADEKVTATEKKIAELEAEIKRLKGDDDVPVGGSGGGVGRKAHESAADWTPQELAALMKARGLD